MNKMHQKVKKMLWGLITFAVVSGAGLWAANIDLQTDLNHAIQQIPIIIFAQQNSNGSWQSTGQVQVSSTTGTVYISGALVTNYEENNDVPKGNTGNAFSLLGGSNNTMTNAQESTLIGGKHNKISSPQSFIVGGEGNSILGTSYRSTILGGKNSQIQGESSTLIGGNESSIFGHNSILIGGNNKIVGDNAFAAGNGANVTASGSFAWSDGIAFSVSQPNLFALQGSKGVAVGKSEPHAVAQLTLSGALRIEKQTKNIDCKGDTAGVIKSVSTGSKLCSCVCDGANWKAVLDTPSCLQQCGDPRYKDIDKNDFDPNICGSTYRTCKGSGVLLDYKQYIYSDDTSTVNTWYWMCQNPNTSKPIKCKVEFKCENLNGVDVSKAKLCPYGDGSSKSDARELNTGTIQTKLVGEGGSRCPSVKSPTNQQGACNNTLSDQSKKCEYYCPDGFHKEGNACIENSCPAQSVTVTESLGTATYNVPCLNHGSP
jgi:hypothetical protein